MINSMTPEERANPDLIDSGRRKRIAKGAGKDITEMNAFMKQFGQMRDMMKGMNKMGMFGKIIPIKMLPRLAGFYDLIQHILVKHIKFRDTPPIQLNALL